MKWFVVQNDQISIRIYICFSSHTFQVGGCWSCGRGRMATLNIYEVLLSCDLPSCHITCHICLALDITCPHQAWGRVMNINITFEVIFIWSSDMRTSEDANYIRSNVAYKLSYMFSARYHFSSSGMRKSNEHQHIIWSYLHNPLKWWITPPSTDTFGLDE